MTTGRRRVRSGRIVASCASASRQLFDFDSFGNDRNEDSIKYKIKEEFTARTVKGLRRLTARTVEAMEGAVILVGVVCQAGWIRSEAVVLVPHWP